MATNATIFKADLRIADMDRHYYQDHALTIARHPSETDERMMVRILAFALNADSDLVYTKGLSTDDEPDIWQKNLNGDIELWIDVGQPDEKRIRKACGRARQVIIYPYGGRGAELWWDQTQARLERFRNLAVINLPAEDCAALAALTTRTMRIQCNIQDGQIWLASGDQAVQIDPVRWK